MKSITPKRLIIVIVWVYNEFVSITVKFSFRCPTVKLVDHNRKIEPGGMTPNITKSAVMPVRRMI